MRRFGRAWLAAFCVGGGLVFDEFVRALRPVDYLVRPLVGVAVLAVVVAVAAALLRGWSVIAAVFAIAWIVRPQSPVALGVSVIAVGLVVWRLWKQRAPNASPALTSAAAVFFAAGLIPIVPLMSWSSPARADTQAGPPQYLILLDGHPRADSLAAHGVDISSFVDDLKERGFDVYPEATSLHNRTMQTLTAMTGGDPEQWGFGIQEQRQLRDGWRLPDGFVAIAPPIGIGTLPHTPTLNPGGFSFFEARLLADSLFTGVAGDWVMDGYRTQLDRALDVLASTSERRVFAHLFAPHPPILYDAHGNALSADDTWALYAETNPRPPDMTISERAASLGGYVHWLDRELVDVVDKILKRRPDAEIVLFSDHGGRFDNDDPDEWHRVFLAAHTPTRPGLFVGSPHPRSVLEAVK